ncbi:MAG: polysaccharide pyruvyl transferase family protein [Bacteroidia bacterium]
MNRRNFIKDTGLYSMGSLLIPFVMQGCSKPDPTLLVISGWQDVNIGDIAHTPGLLHILETFLPEANIILWKKSAGEEVKKLLNESFPKVKIIFGEVDQEKNVDSPEVLAAFDSADLMIHGSGPSVVGQVNLEAWVKHSNKPFGIFGTTIQTINDNLKVLLQKASFIYTRETASIKALEEAGITGEHISFAPDATFFLNLHDEAKAQQFLQEHGLEEKKIICAIPRLRYTPYHKIRKVDWTEERIQMVESVNAETKEKDHAKLREAMITWVRETGNKVLICPEMTYQVDIMDELLLDPLPEDVKPFVVKRGYWMPDEAASVYLHAHTVLSCECHSPIMAIANGTPAFYLRQPTDTIKGQMYYDLNLSDWVFEIDETEGKQISDTLMAVYNDYDSAKLTVKKVNERIGGIYSNAVEVAKEAIG